MFDTVSEAQYRRLIGKTAGRAFFLFGDEDYLKLHAVRVTRESVCPDPAFAVFNDIVIDATDYSADALLNAMTPPPMMADGRLILVRGLDLTAMKQSEVDALCETLALLPEYDFNTVLVLIPAGNIDLGYFPKKPSQTFKKLAEVATPVHFETVSDARLAAWAGKHFAHFGVQAGGAECAFLVSYVGHSMFLLANEIEKLAYYLRAKGRDSVGEQDIRHVCMPLLENDTFALSNAIMAGRGDLALDALRVIKFQRVEPTIVMGDVSATVSNMYATRVMMDAGRTQKDISKTLNLHEYKTGLMMQAVRRIPVPKILRALSLCAETDFAIKNSKASADYGAIEELICAL